MKRWPWYRMWADARNDSKLDALNDREFRIWFKLLCYAAESEPRGEVDYIDPEFIAMELRIGSDELDSAISRMVRLRLVERSDTKVMFQSFTARQYDKPSDLPEAKRERVRKYREKAREGEVSRDVTRSNALVTRREEKSRKEKNRGGAGGESTTPKEIADPQSIADIIAGFKQQLGIEASE